MDATKQTFAIIFGKVPSNYTAKDMILNHLSFKSKADDTITSSKLERWRRAIRLIDIDEEKHECKVIFSSIFYWCKYSRHVLSKEKKLSVAICPKYFQSILHPSNIDLIASNCNNQLIKLYNLPSSIVSYTFTHNDTIYVSSKLKSHQELLFKIPTSKISDIKLLGLSKENESDEMKKAGECDVILELNQQCEILEYYHRHNLWICTQCGSVNNAKRKSNKNALNTIPKRDDDLMKCVCCNAKLSENNDYHLYDLNNMWKGFSLNGSADKHCDVNLEKKRFSFVQQSSFYRKISSFNTNNLG